jgi:tetratricopeptide (TPR) repeat protein
VNGLGHPPLRVEQALRLLPDVDALAPLRGFLISKSQARPSVEPHGTVGKRTVQPSELKEMIPEAVESVVAHITALCLSGMEALEAEQSGDIPGVVRALLPAGRREEDIGRHVQARAWYEAALRVAEGLRDRRPEIETLRHLAHLEQSRGHFEQAARLYTRSFTLADAEMDQSGAALACQGLGDVALAHGKWQGAEAWFKRGLTHAAEDPLRHAFLLLGLGEVARCRGLLEVASERIGLARQLFEKAGNVEGKIHTLNAWGLLEADLGRNNEAVAAWRDALAELYRSGNDPRLEMQIRLNLCKLYLDWSRLAEAEDEIRKAEDLAIVHDPHETLARLYLLLGKLRGKQNDETGFVFFENAIVLCQGATPLPRLEADVYREYAQFRHDLGEPDEAIAYLGRAREILETFGDEALLVKVESELEHMKPK